MILLAWNPTFHWSFTLKKVFSFIIHASYLFSQNMLIQNSLSTKYVLNFCTSVKKTSTLNRKRLFTMHVSNWILLLWNGWIIDMCFRYNLNLFIDIQYLNYWMKYCSMLKHFEVLKGTFVFMNFSIKHT